MAIESIQCPNCGKTTAGKFCSHCGAPARASDGSTRVKAGNVSPVVPWTALGISVLALIVALGAWFAHGERNAAPEMAAMPPAAGDMPSAVDLSSMSPREAADRLYNRIMAAAERGDAAEAARFTPMALQAYDNLGGLDEDARYHVALIYLVAGDVKSAQAQLDRLRKTAPHHLLGFMLAQQIAERNKNKDGAARAYKGFLAAYDAEMAQGRVEYQDHQGAIEHFRQAAKASGAGQK